MTDPPVDKPSDDRHDDDANESLYDAAMRHGLIGCIEGPEDLSTNPKYMEGFGESRSDPCPPPEPSLS